MKATFAQPCVQLSSLVKVVFFLATLKEKVQELMEKWGDKAGNHGEMCKDIKDHDSPSDLDGSFGFGWFGGGLVLGDWVCLSWI